MVRLPLEVFLSVLPAPLQGFDAAAVTACATWRVTPSATWAPRSMAVEMPSPPRIDERLRGSRPDR